MHLLSSDWDTTRELQNSAVWRRLSEEKQSINFVLPLTCEVSFFYVRLPKIEHHKVQRQKCEPQSQFLHLWNQVAGLTSLLAPSSSNHLSYCDNQFYFQPLAPLLHTVIIITLFKNNKSNMQTSTAETPSTMAILKDKIETHIRIN